jgi:hypothetical protein
MNTRILLTACTALLLLGAAQAAEYTESAVETTTAVMHFPDSVPQRISVRACDSCLAKELEVNAKTAYFVGHSPVTLDVLRKSAASTNTWVYVFYDARQKVITRIKLAATLDPSSSVSATPVTKRRGN